jgi:hypothetical protein
MMFDRVNLMAIPTIFSVIIFFGKDFKYGECVNFCGYFVANSEPLCVQFCNFLLSYLITLINFLSVCPHLRTLLINFEANSSNLLQHC